MANIQIPPPPEANIYKILIKDMYGKYSNIHPSQIFTKYPPQANIHQIIKYIWQILSKYSNIHLSQQNILLTMSSQ